MLNFRKPEKSAGHEPNCQDPSSRNPATRSAQRRGSATEVGIWWRAEGDPAKWVIPATGSPHTWRPRLTSVWCRRQSLPHALTTYRLAHSSRVFQPLAGPENRRGCFSLQLTPANLHQRSLDCGPSRAAPLPFLPKHSLLVELHYHDRSVDEIDGLRTAG